MQRDPLPASADAYAPDPDRAGTVVPERLSSLLVDMIAFLVIAMLRRCFPGRFPRLPSWWHHRPDLPPGSAQQLAAATRGEFGTAIAWMCRRRGIGPGHRDWPYLARTIVAFGGSVARFRPGLPACGLQWWENPNIIAGMIGDAPETPAADALATLLSRQTADDMSPPPEGVPAMAMPVLLRASWLAPRPTASCRRASTGPPIGPPVALTLPGFLCLIRGASPWLVPPP